MSRIGRIVAGSGMAAALMMSSVPVSASPLVDQVQTKVASLNWRSTHGSATAFGVTDLQGSTIGGTAVVKGELNNAGPGCYSVWTKWAQDLFPGVYRKVVSQCGVGTTPLEERKVVGLLTSGSLIVCSGSTGTGNCGTEVRVY